MDQSPEIFTRLMEWLHPNPDEAGQEYRRIHALLIRYFKKHGCSSPENLADATVDRTATTLEDEQIKNWKGKKDPYFFRVAYYILLEAKSPEIQIADEFDIATPDKNETAEIESRCLEKCLKTLSNSEQELIVSYYQGTKAIKIMNRKALAEKLKLSLPLLRVRAHRRRSALRKCIEDCLEQALSRSPFPPG